MWNLNIIDSETSEPNKAGEEFIRLTQEEWMSNMLVEPTVLETGVGFHFRGFKGNYILRVVQGGEEVGEVEVEVTEDTTINCSYLDTTGLTC